ncbi:hypothetical protein AALA61_12350 [Oscillospiraceae bacterium 42-9]
MREFWNRVNKIILGGITVIVTLALNFLGWCFGPNASVPMWVVWLILIGSYIICIFVYALASKSSTVTYVLPRVKSIRHNDKKIIFLLEKNELFMQGAYITIAYQDEDDLIEIILGLGYVETVNPQGNMQVVFINQVEDQQATDIIKGLSDKKHSRNAIKIKPTIQKTFLEEEINLWGTF